jgi:uncharacterized protein YbjQ (UPF0145 family)
MKPFTSNFSLPFRTSTWRVARTAALGLCLLPLALAPHHTAHAQAKAGHGAHVHGQVQANVAVQGNKLSVQFEIPLDSLLGFEHRPRTDAQRQAAQATVQELKQAANWLKPDAAAGCTLSNSEVDAQALEPAKPGAREQTHADLDASYEFTCAAPEQLAGLDILLANSFKRIKRLEVQVAGAKTQSKQTLRAPATRVRLR